MEQAAGASLGCWRWCKRRLLNAGLALVCCGVTCCQVWGVESEQSSGLPKSGHSVARRKRQSANMASTSHGDQVAPDPANPTSSENSDFGWNPGSMTFRRNELVVYDQLLEGPDCNIGTTTPTTTDAASPATVTDLFQLPVNGEQDAVADSTVPMQLLNQTTQEARQQMASKCVSFWQRFR